MTPSSVLITGACGLVGRALTDMLRPQGYRVVGYDLVARGDERGDVCDIGGLRAAVRGVDGVIHLGAVSRVLWGERDPARCLATNIDGTRNVLDAARASPTRPWVLFASSREVYGECDELPVREEAPLRPVNVYGRSKVAGEELVLGARSHGLSTAVVRLSNVYGRASDHADRVVPAFARSALRGDPLRVDGADNLFDFTFIDDVARGLCAIVDRLREGAVLPSLHLVSGEGTTLGALAALAVELAGSGSDVTLAASRRFDVARFRGDPARAHAVVGWEAKTSLRDGLFRLMRELRAEDVG